MAIHKEANNKSKAKTTNNQVKDKNKKVQRNKSAIAQQQNTIKNEEGESLKKSNPKYHARLYLSKNQQIYFQDFQQTLKIRNPSFLLRQKQSLKINFIQKQKQHQILPNWNEKSVSMIRKTFNEKQSRNLHQLQTNFYIQKISSLQKTLLQKQKLIIDLKEKLISEQRIKKWQCEKKRLKEQNTLIMQENSILKMIIQNCN